MYRNRLVWFAPDNKFKKRKFDAIQLNDGEFILELQGTTMNLFGHKNKYTVTVVEADVKSYQLGNTTANNVAIIGLISIFIIALFFQLFGNGMGWDGILGFFFAILFHVSLQEVLRRKALNYWVVIKGIKQNGEEITFLLHDGRFVGWWGAITKNKLMLKEINKEIQQATRS